MEKYTTFINWNVQHCKEANSLQTDLESQWSTNQNQAGILVEIKNGRNFKWILNYTLRYKGARLGKAIF